MINYTVVSYNRFALRTHTLLYNILDTTQTTSTYIQREMESEIMQKIKSTYNKYSVACFALRGRMDKVF